MQSIKKVISIEDHFWIPELRAARNPNWTLRLDDLESLRLREMDAAQIDFQVISHAPPAVQNLPAERAIALARQANDLLHRATAAHPDRFGGFAILPTPAPDEAADELERSVTQLGFKGAMIHGTTHGSFLDEKRFWVILEKAQSLDVPIYIHPGSPDPSMVSGYYRDYPAMAHAGWGFNVEAATHAIRLILSGAFDAYPKLKIIIGHMGEMLPYELWRCDALLTRDSSLKRTFREYFLDHFYITTSGNFSVPALQCAIAEMGADRIIFSVDWPYASNIDARRFLEDAPLSTTDRSKLFHENAERLLRL
jgi:predicted TIM-barrel fold metal-dependent hydrolase